MGKQSLAKVARHCSLAPIGALLFRTADWSSGMRRYREADSEAKDVISGIYKAGLDKIAEMSGN